MTLNSGRLKVAILMMQRDETSLLPVFLGYHESLFGSSSLHVFDNGSTDPSVIAELKASEGRGVRVFWDHATAKDFEEKGHLFASYIQHLDRVDPHDFYLPMDCDEFIACLAGDGVSLDRAEIDRALMPFRGCASTLRISHKYWANPLHRNHYRIITWSPKCFFATEACESLDHGYHHGVSRHSSPDQITPIVYYELHYKTYLLHRRLSEAKLAPFLTDYSRRSLREFLARKYHNHHCAEDLLMSKYDYLSLFSRDQYPINNPLFLRKLQELGLDDQLLFEPVPAVGMGPWLVWLKFRRNLVGLQATVQELLEDCRGLLVRTARRLFGSL